MCLDEAVVVAEICEIKSIDIWTGPTTTTSKAWRRTRIAEETHPGVLEVRISRTDYNVRWAEAEQIK